MNIRKSSQIVLPARKVFEFWIVLTIALTTIFFWTPALDAFNYPKSALLMISSSSLFILMLPTFFDSFRKREFWLSFYLPVLLWLWLIVVALVHGIGRAEILWGVFSRANGFLTTSSFLMVTIMLCINTSHTLVVKIASGALLTLTIIVFYGFAQLLGKDPVNWVNPYNEIIATFGNPNFSAAGYVVLSLISLHFATLKGTHVAIRIFATSVILAALYLSYMSQSAQGVLSFIAAIELYIVAKIFVGRVNRVIKILVITFLAPLNILVLLGLINNGPLKEVIYQYTLSVRGHYWRVALDMIRDYPLFGVGQDSFGLYYQQYRELEFVRQYGPSLITNNAHNVFLQAGSTTGAISMILLLLMAILIVSSFLKNYRKFSGSTQNLYLSFFVAWFAYTLQSLVSIEQIGIAVWGWVLNGILLGFPRLTHALGDKEFLWHRINFPATFTYLILVGLLLYPGTSFVRQDLELRKALGQPVASDNMVASQERGQAILNAVTPMLTLQEYSNFAIRNLFQAGPADVGVKVAEDSLVKNPRLYTSLQLLTSAYKQYGQTEKAIVAYEKMEELDPFNFFNLIEYSKLLISMQKNAEAEEKLLRVIEIGNVEAVGIATEILKQIS